MELLSKEVTLSRTHKLETRVKEKITILEAELLRLTSPKVSPEETSVVPLNFSYFTELAGLYDALVSLRRLIAERNHAFGISALLTDLSAIDKQITFLSRIQAHSLQHGETSFQYTAQGAQRNYVYSTAPDVAPTLQALAKNKISISDKIAELNQRQVTVTLPKQLFEELLGL